MRNATANLPVAPGAVTVATAADVTFIRHLQRRFSNQLGFLPNAAIEQYVRARRVLLIRDNGEPAGYLLGPARLASLPWVRPLVHTAISFDAQRQSLGLQLVTATATAATAAGQTHLQAWCRADLPANAFWLAAGFFPVAQRRTDNRRRRPLILWRRPLTANVGAGLLQLPRRAGWRSAELTAAEFFTPAQVRHILDGLPNGKLPPSRRPQLRHGEP